MKSYLQNKEFLRFLGKALLLFALYLLVVKSSFLDVFGVNRLIISNLMETSSIALQALGYEVVSHGADIGLHSGFKVHIGEPCNALDLMILFSCILILIPGLPKNKLAYILVGNLLIHVLNILRVIALVLLINFKPEWVNFNHTYTFTLIIYAVIFALWILWSRKFAFYKFGK